MQTKRVIGVLTLGLGLTLALLAGLHTAQAAPTGTPLFVKPTGSGGACSQAAPCALQTALGQAADGDTVYVAGGAYTGTGSAVITRTKSITLTGGWNGLTGALVVSPTAYPATLDGEWARRVVHISGNITPSLDGFIVTRGNATGQITDCPGIHGGPAGCGGGIFVYQASPLIVNNVITNNVAAGAHANATGYGGGLYLKYAHGAVISGNVVISNVARLTGYGDGGGLYLEQSNAQVQFNQVLGNHATMIINYGWGGGISAANGAPTVEGNVLRGNWVNPSGTDRYGAAIYTWNDSGTYLGNQMADNHGESAVYLQYSSPRFESNQVISNATSCGFDLFVSSGGGSTLINNVVARSGGYAIRAAGQAGNVLTATLLHNTLVGSNTGFGVLVNSYVALSLTNTIIASHTWGITNTTPASSTVLADHTLFWATTYPGIQGTDPLNGDPRFVNPAGGDYHLGPGSAAIDVGASTAITTDMDGDPRPIGPLPDIGADERRMYVYLPLVLRAW